MPDESAVKQEMGTVWAGVAPNYGMQLSERIEAGKKLIARIMRDQFDMERLELVRTYLAAIETAKQMVKDTLAIADNRGKKVEFLAEYVHEFHAAKATVERVRAALYVCEKWLERFNIILAGQPVEPDRLGALLRSADDEMWAKAQQEQAHDRPKGSPQQGGTGIHPLMRERRALAELTKFEQECDPRAG